MITLEKYLRDPCGALSIPYWKWQRTQVPKNMEIVHERDYKAQENHEVQRFFRLKHDLQNIPRIEIAGLEIKTARPEDYSLIESIVRRCYPGIRIEEGWLENMAQLPVHVPNLWRISYLKGIPVGCILADVDPQAGEGILEWVQVLPEYRENGIGQAMVCEVLHQMEASFATVSGNLDNETQPEKLYRSCGFSGNDVWYILRKK